MKNSFIKCLFPGICKQGINTAIYEINTDQRLNSSQSYDKNKFNGFEYVCIAAEDTTLPFEILLASSGATKIQQRKFIFDFFSGDKWVEIPILREAKEDTFGIPKTLEAQIVAKWASENYDILTDHLNGKMTDKQALNMLKPIRINDRQ